MDYYKRYMGDYQRDTAHLSLTEHGAYTVLLDHYYARRKALPDDMGALMRLCRATSKLEQKAVQFIVDEFFPVDPADGLRHNKKADEVLAEWESRAESSRANGKLGGRKKKSTVAHGNGTSGGPNGNPGPNLDGTQDGTQKEPTGNLPGFQSGFGRLSAGVILSPKSGSAAPYGETAVAEKNPNEINGHRNPPGSFQGAQTEPTNNLIQNPDPDPDKSKKEEEEKNRTMSDSAFRARNPIVMDPPNTLQRAGLPFDAIAGPPPEPEPQPARAQQRPTPEKPHDTPRLPLDLAPDPGDPVQRVFDHWRTVHQHPRAKLDAKRVKLIRKALKLYTEADLCQAISGYRNSPHHMGQNDRDTVYDSIEVMLRDSKQVDQGLKFYANPPRANLSRLTRENVARTEDWEPPEVRAARQQPAH